MKIIHRESNRNKQKIKKHFIFFKLLHHMSVGHQTVLYTGQNSNGKVVFNSTCGQERRRELMKIPSGGGGVNRSKTQWPMHLESQSKNTKRGHEVIRIEARIVGPVGQRGRGNERMSGQGGRRDEKGRGDSDGAKRSGGCGEAHSGGIPAIVTSQPGGGAVPRRWPPGHVGPPTARCSVPLQKNIGESQMLKQI